jgi:phosphatidylserine/phosphatidylglycerophosphate/cardiolipin synthase-like enzyme
MRGPSRIKRRSTLALHAKSMVVDGQIAVVGSFNLDPRSANLNTESVAILHSVPVALQLQERMETEMGPENAWHTTLEFNPDREASLGARIKVRLARVVPRLLL